MDEEQEGEMEQKAKGEDEAPEKPAETRPKKRGSRSSSTTKKERSRDNSLAARQQQLFLVEFLVDTVTIDSCSVDEEILQGQTCLSLTFLNFPPMEICEKDFNPGKESGLDKVHFNCGKSLMFAFNENQCDHPPPLTLEITVSKKLDDEENPCKVDIGVIKICVSELFRQIVDIAKFKPEKLPASKSIKDCFMLVGPGKRTMGEVSVYIRLSCLGQNVVTEFQCGPDLKTSPVLFKNREGKKVFQFSGNEPEGEGESGAGRAGGCGCIPQGPDQGPGAQGDGGRSSPSGGGATYAAKGNKVVLDIPEKGNRCPGGQKRARARPKEDMSVSRVNANPDQNVFVLRVGDKGQIPDRGKMILEFRTPKQKILPKNLPPYHEDIAVQTDSPKKGKGKKKK